MKKEFIIFNHDMPEDTYIVCCKDKKDVSDLHELTDGDWIVEEIDCIVEGKKSLIANDDENVIEYVSNVTDDEWLNMLKKAYEDDKNTYGLEEDWEESGPLSLYIDAGDVESVDDYIAINNGHIEDSEVDCDSSYQLIWYTSESIMSLDEFKTFLGFDECEEDDED